MPLGILDKVETGKNKLNKNGRLLVDQMINTRMKKLKMNESNPDAKINVVDNPCHQSTVQRFAKSISGIICLKKKPDTHPHTQVKPHLLISSYQAKKT